MRTVLFSMAAVVMVCHGGVASEEQTDGEWCVPAPLNYGAWGRDVGLDFPDGDVEGKLAKMARVGMTTYFFMRGETAFHEELFAAARRHQVRLYLRMFGAKVLSAQDAADHPEWLTTVEWARQQRYACPSWIDVWASDLPEQERFLRQHRDHLFGVNVDFIRYMDDDPCHCDPCRNLYQQYLGRDHLTEEDLSDPQVARPYIQLRGRVIGETVGRLRAICDRLGLKLSAAVFPNREHGRFLGQDWVAWAQQGWVDFVCPMSYTHDREQHRTWAREHLAALGDAAELWEAVARTWSGGENTPPETLQQSLDVLREGVQGLSSYRLSAFTEEDWELQRGLPTERGWRLRRGGEVLTLEGPPFGEIRLPPWPLRCCVLPESEALVEPGPEGTVVRSRRLWVHVDLSPRSGRPSETVHIPVECHNGTDQPAAYVLRAKGPPGWTLREPTRPLSVGAQQTKAAECVVAVPEDAEPGDYWIEIDALQPDGRFIPRARPPVAAGLGGETGTVVPITETHATSAPTWLRVTVSSGP